MLLEGFVHIAAVKFLNAVLELEKLLSGCQPRLSTEHLLDHFQRIPIKFQRFVGPGLPYERRYKGVQGRWRTRRAILVISASVYKLGNALVQPQRNLGPSHGTDKGMSQFMKNHGSVKFAVLHHPNGNTELTVENGPNPLWPWPYSLIFRRLVQDYMHLVFWAEIKKMNGEE